MTNHTINLNQVEGIEVEVKLKEANYISNSRNVQLLTSEQLSPCLDVAEYIPEELFFAADEDSIEGIMYINIYFSLIL